MSIRVEAVVHPSMKFSSADEKRARKRVESTLERGEKLGMSSSGQTLMYAVDWCERAKRQYQITAWPGVGYYLEVLPTQ